MATFRANAWIELTKDRSISQLMQHNVSNTPSDKVIYEDTLTGKSATYGGFREQVMRSAYWLQHTAGLRAGHIVTIVAPSCIDYLLVAHSVWWVGGVVATINNAFNTHEIENGIAVIEPDCMVVHDTVFEKIESVIKSSSTLDSLKVLTLGKPHSKWLQFPTESSTSDKARLIEPFSLTGKDSSKFCATIVLSSGTTGRPKGVMLSHYNLVSTCEQLRADNPENWRASQREIFFPPLSHIYGLYVCATMCCWVGAYVCMVPRFDLGVYCRLMQDRKATLARLVPPVAKQLAENPIVDKYTYPFLEYFSCSAAPLKGKLASELTAKFPNVVLVQTYGCTELSGAIVQSGVRDKGMPEMAVGTFISNIEARFCDENGENVSATGPGEIVVRGPNVMIGYKNNPSATAESLDKDGWLRTGDLGYMDPTGYLMIYDRTKDIIKYKGFQVSPAEVEEVLFMHSDVLDAAVCGIWSDDESTELPKAFIVTKSPLKTLDAEKTIANSIHEFASRRLSNYKHLRGGIVFLDALPRNPTGKILRRVLREMDAASGHLAPVPAKL